MKKFFATLMSGIIISTLTSTAKAQTFNVSTEVAVEDAPATAEISKANMRATNYFNKHFVDGADVKWFDGKATITASMSRDGKYTRVVYDRKGRWLYTMTTYDETKLVKDLRKLIKTNYFDYDITQVQEIKEGQNVFYIFHLEDQANYKQVALYDGELHVLKDFKKQQK